MSIAYQLRKSFPYAVLLFATLCPRFWKHAQRRRRSTITLTICQSVEQGDRDLQFLQHTPRIAATIRGINPRPMMVMNDPLKRCASDGGLLQRFDIGIAPHSTDMSCACARGGPHIDISLSDQVPTHQSTNGRTAQVTNVSCRRSQDFFQQNGSQSERLVLTCNVTYSTSTKHSEFVPF